MVSPYCGKENAKEPLAEPLALKTCLIDKTKALRLYLFYLAGSQVIFRECVAAFL
jgi:hypothetical protein